MSDKRDSAIDTIATQIINSVAASSNALSFVKTENGIIVKVINVNKYEVSIKGTVYTVPSLVSCAYSEDDVVLIMLLQGDYNNKYIIGKVGGGFNSTRYYYEPLTNGNSDTPELIFYNGDIVMAEVF